MMKALVFSLLLRGTKKKKVCSYHFCPAIYQRFKPVHWGKASLVAQTVKCLPAVWETWVQSLGWEDPLEKEMATHSSTLAWKIPWIEEPGRLQSMGSQRVRPDWATSLSLGQGKEVFFFNWIDYNKRSKNVFAEYPEKCTLKSIEFFFKLIDLISKFSSIKGSKVN